MDLSAAAVELTDMKKASTKTRRIRAPPALIFGIYRDTA